MGKGFYMKAIRDMVQNKRCRLILGMDDIRSYSLDLARRSNPYLLLLAWSLGSFISKLLCVLQIDSESGGFHTTNLRCPSGSHAKCGPEIPKGRGESARRIQRTLWFPQGYAKGSHVLIHRIHGLC